MITALRYVTSARRRLSLRSEHFQLKNETIRVVIDTSKHLVVKSEPVKIFAYPTLKPNAETVAAMEAVRRGEYTYADE